MAPTEEQILSTFLLSASSLHSIFTLDKFAKLFPAKYQNHPYVQALYRDLQHQRGLVAEQVKQNIANEAALGEKQCREVVRRRRREERLEFRDRDGENDAVERAAHTALFGGSTNLEHRVAHSLKSMNQSLEAAILMLQQDLSHIEQENKATLADISTTISDLSDLRYGKFSSVAGTNVGQDVVERLQKLETICSGADTDMVD